MNTQYKQLIKNILENGTLQKGRNGNTLIIPHASFTVDFRTESPLLQLRKMYTKGIIGEFLTLMDPTPLTNISQFEENGCNYWKLWADVKGELNIDYHNKLYPQWHDIIAQMIEEPESRRHVVSLWDHEHVMSQELSLPCCWHGMTFSIINQVIHMTWHQRSVDTLIGLPSDVMLAYMFMTEAAEQTGYDIGSCMFSLSNVHIYEEHIDGAKELLMRTVADRNTPINFELKQ